MGFRGRLAYYRAKEEGPVSIYNQGVLIRHDSSHVWGAGGLIVSKKAINLNVSRTEILRKTCPVWKPIAKEFRRLAEAVSAKLGITVRPKPVGKNRRDRCSAVTRISVKCLQRRR
jgi:hypothetical protein